MKMKKLKMKKLIIATAITISAMIVNAASFDWKLQTGADYSGMKVYALTGTTAASVLTACKSTTEKDWTDTFSGFTASTASGTNARAGASGTATGVAVNDNLVFVIIDGSVAAGSKYWVVNDYKITGNTYEPPATGTTGTIVLSTQGTAGSGTFTAVPEPTSGLMLLLGVAGLALKRKRA